MCITFLWRFSCIYIRTFVLFCQFGKIYKKRPAFLCRTPFVCVWGLNLATKATNLSLYYSIRNRDMCDIRDKLSSLFHKSLKFFFQSVFRSLSSDLRCRLLPGHPLKYLILDDPLHPDRDRQEPLLHLQLNVFRIRLALLQKFFFQT